MVKTLREALGYEPVELGFGTSGLRGLAADMNDLECYINTRGFINYLLESNDIESGETVALAGDYRESTPRILKAVVRGIQDTGCKVVYLGKIPTPAAAYYGLNRDIPVAMVTGSHIPADRNGIKFYKRGGEILKEDENDIKASIAEFRAKIYSEPLDRSLFGWAGNLLDPPELPDQLDKVADIFLGRYLGISEPGILKHKRIVVYQHSSLGADLLVALLKSLGAEVVPVDKSERFISIDTENVTQENRAYFISLAEKYPGSFAIISADGDADRPFIVDETGTFHRGDVVGALTAVFLKAKSASVPISANDAISPYLEENGITLTHTKIGSPYVISSMDQAIKLGLSPAVGWEVNGGFLTGSDIELNGNSLKALPTRDAFLPIIAILTMAVRNKTKVSELFSALPARFTQAGLIDNFPIEASAGIISRYSSDDEQTRKNLSKIFNSQSGFDKIISLNFLDGIRMVFENGDVAHIRPSGNAPQLRIYSNANTQKRADEIVGFALSEPDGLLRKLETLVTG
jgi:phosphomannomutase